MSSDWTVVLSSDDAKQVVLYNARDKQLAVRNSDATPFLSAVNLARREEEKDIGVCSQCKRPFTHSSNTPYIYRDYFQVLEEAYEANSPINQSPKVGPKTSKIPRGSMNTGYYKQFFIELCRLGRGGGGSVFACEHVLNGTVLGRYAVKKVPVGDDTEWLSRLLNEVHMLEAMRHENVIEYRHSWLEEWKPSPFAPQVPHLFILMEFAEEGSLEQVLESSGDRNGLLQRSRIDLYSLFLPISLGLAHLHSRGILHRDMKPSNILLKRDPKTNLLIPMISDFGEARSSFAAEGIRSGATGTIEYTAPELLRSDKKGRFLAKHATPCDIWSLGMIFYRCLYNRLPFKDIDDFEALHEELVSLESLMIPAHNEVPLPLRTLLKAMLSVYPQRRP
jgi:serine/threonine protein kinase